MPTPSATATPKPTPDEPELAIDGFADVVTSDLIVRTAPGTGRDSEILGAVDSMPVFVVDGPVQADGYEWWLVLPEEPYTLQPPPSGWVAAGRQGEVWLAPRHVSCQADPTSEDVWAMPTTEWVGCQGGKELTVRGYLSRCNDAFGGSGNVCGMRNCATKADCEGMADDRGIGLYFEANPPRDEGRIRVTGHFDDALVQDCYISGSGSLHASEAFGCRVGFVVTSYRFTD